MYQSKNPYMYGTGRRKSSVARVRVYPNGSGNITINGRDVEVKILAILSIVLCYIFATIEIQF